METQEKKPSSPITGHEGAPIELDLAAQWTENHRHRNPKDNISQFFGREILNTILNQPDCMGIRIYYANDQRLNGWQKFWIAISNFLLSVIANVGGQQHFIITGVLETGEDQLPEDSAPKAKTPEGVQTFSLMSATTSNTLGEMSIPCRAQQDALKIDLQEKHPNTNSYQLNMPLDVLLQNISVVSGIFPVVVMLINYRQLDKILKLASLYFIISFSVDSYLWLSFHLFREKNTMPVFHSYVIISILLLGLVYYNMYINTKLKIVAIILCTITMLIALFYAQSILLYPSISITSLSVLLIILSLIYFYQLLNPHEFVHLEKQSLFWINTGILFYSAVNIFLFMVLNSIPKADQHNYYMIHSVTNIIANILYSIGLLCKPQKTS